MRRIANNRPVSWSGVLWTAVVLAAAAVGFVACLQAEGERCQVNADCQDELICCVGDKAEDVLRGGVCQQADKCVLLNDDAGVPDSSVADAAVGDAVFDGQADADAVVTDAAVEDASADGEPQQTDGGDAETGVADAGPDAPPADAQ